MKRTVFWLCQVVIASCFVVGGYVGLTRMVSPGAWAFIVTVPLLAYGWAALPSPVPAVLRFETITDALGAILSAGYVLGGLAIIVVGLRTYGSPWLMIGLPLGGSVAVTSAVAGTIFIARVRGRRESGRLVLAAIGTLLIVVWAVLVLG